MTSGVSSLKGCFVKGRTNYNSKCRTFEKVLIYRFKEKSSPCKIKGHLLVLNAHITCGNSKIKHFWPSDYLALMSFSVAAYHLPQILGFIISSRISNYPNFQKRKSMAQWYLLQCLHRLSIFYHEQNYT